MIVPVIEMNECFGGTAPAPRVYQPLMTRGSSIWWRGQVDFGFW